jgi:trans-aconitate methyltransferase
MTTDRWENAATYDRFMGRWSRPVAREFVRWLDIPPSAAWLEIGCGTGSLTSAICELANPASVLACDTAPDYVAYCKAHLTYPQLSVEATTPGQIPSPAFPLDAVVSNLVLNFLPDPIAALDQMRDVCAPDACVAAAVWDYSDGMEFLRLFWDAATALDPAAAALDEGRRFPICQPEPLRRAFDQAGLRSICIDPIDIATVFSTFDDFWTPFVNGPGPAPTYVSQLSDSAQQQLATRLRHSLGTEPFRLRARAWAAKGVRGVA